MAGIGVSGGGEAGAAGGETCSAVGVPVGAAGVSGVSEGGGAVGVTEVVGVTGTVGVTGGGASLGAAISAAGGGSGADGCETGRIVGGRARTRPRGFSSRFGGSIRGGTVLQAAWPRRDARGWRPPVRRTGSPARIPCPRCRVFCKHRPGSCCRPLAVSLIGRCESPNRVLAFHCRSRSAPTVIGQE